MSFSILYRGPLVSCNYGCEYCPFAKRQQTAMELGGDRQALERFATWIKTQSHHKFSILFTPWGEALIHSWYQNTLTQLSHLPNIRKVAIQTNLSCSLNWVGQANANTLALWTTFHPEWSDMDTFLQKCHTLMAHRIQFSVGVVGFPRFRQAIAQLRQALPSSIYLWINAVKSELPQLQSTDRAFFQAIDPLYELNTQHYPSLGKACRAGQSVFSVDGDGTMRRCHFIKTPIGNIYNSEWEKGLGDRPCTNETCHCHIGYVHLEELALDHVFGDGILERIPSVATESLSIPRRLG
ncbi:MAG: radical SAM protein [Merismopedia sp. SIO2A8]|nr:radical SAM protein [Symploca sp. SIO2B6]NET50881.1 radical SAM protein [Merismopedia sp. SIO2A8]